MSQIRWRNGQLFSMQLRDGSYALLQMLAKKRQVAVLNCFSKEDNWTDIELDSSDVLFVTTLLRSVLKRSVLNIHKDIQPIKDIEIPQFRISIGSEFRTVVLWPGTEDERRVLTMGKGNNKLYRVICEGETIREEVTPISVDDYDKYVDLELTNLSDYPSFNERLYLCCLLGKKIDPLKEMAFNRSLSKESRTYIDIIGGKTPLAELGY